MNAATLAGALCNFVLQGREKDFIIMTCVRSSEHQGIGFLNDPRRTATLAPWHPWPLATLSPCLPVTLAPCHPVTQYIAV